MHALTASIVVDSLYERIDFRPSFNRTRYVLPTRKLLQIELAEKVVEKAELSREGRAGPLDIDDVASSGLCREGIC